MRNAHRLSLVLALAVFAGCESDSETKPDATDTTDTRDGSDTDTRDTDTSTGSVPTLTSVQANEQGAQGLNLRLTVVGSDKDKDIERVRVRLFDGAGQPLNAFREGLSDTLNSNETVLAFDFATDVTNKENILATVTLRGLLASFDPKKVEVALIDGDGFESSTVEADVTAQAVVNQGDACDDTYTDNRCQPGLGCRDGQCQEGLAPEITKVAYLNGQGGVRILVAGTEPEDDIEAIVLH